MGFSILWIMIYHSNIGIPYILSPLKTIKDIGYAGVDIFFLLSGIGIAFSITNNSSITQFYSKRILRILPTFWLFLLFVFIKDITTQDINIVNTLASFLGLDFLFWGKLNYWFIPSISICYLFTPLYYHLLCKYHTGQVLLASVLFIICISLIITGTSLSRFLIFTIRIPIFLFGLHIGLLIVHKKNSFKWNNAYINTALLCISFSILTILLSRTSSSFLWHTGLWWYPTIIMAFPLSMLIAFLLNRSQTYFPIISPILHFFGVYSLELYLIHTLLFNLADTLLLGKTSWNFLRIPEFVICTSISLILSILMKFSINKVNRALTQPHISKR